MGRFLSKDDRIHISLIVILLGLALNATHLWLRFSEKEETTPFPTEIYESEAQLSCKETLNIANWAMSKSMLAKGQRTNSPQHTKKIVQNLLAKLDPNKILITAAEVEKWTAQADEIVREWRDGNCLVVEKIKASWKKEAELRLFTFVSHWNPSSFHVVGEQPEYSDSVEPPKYNTYAKDEFEINIRLREFSEHYLKQASQALLAAYQGNVRNYLKETFVQNLIEPIANSRTLITKAYLSAIDPYATYFDPREYQQFMNDLSAETTGIGVLIKKVPSGLFIQRVHPGTPAERCKKLHAGDVITHIDGVSLKWFSAIHSGEMLRGGANTRVTLKIHHVHDKAHPVEEVILTREAIATDDSRAQFTEVGLPNSPKKVGFIQIPSFYGPTYSDGKQDEKSITEDLREILQKIAQRPDSLSALVIDLRGNPGGYLEEAVSAVGLFLGSRPVVQVQEGTFKRVLRSYEPKSLFKGEVILWIDENTASAAEVFAASMRDYAKAIIIGAERSFGKGTVQRMFHLEDNGMIMPGGPEGVNRGVVKLTTSIFYSPKGHTPVNGGVASDIIISEVKDSTKAPSLEMPIPETDSVFAERTEPISVSTERIDSRLQRFERFSEIPLDKTQKTGRAIKFSELYQDDNKSDKINVDSRITKQVANLAKLLIED